MAPAPARRGKAVEKGAIKGAIGGAFSGLAEGSSLGEFFNAEGVHIDSIGNVADLAARGALEGAIGGALSTAYEGSFGENVAEGAAGGAIGKPLGRLYDDEIGKDLKQAVSENVSQPLGNYLGIDVTAKYEGLTRDIPLNLRSVLQVGIYQGVVGGAIEGLADVPKTVLRGELTSLGKFDADKIFDPIGKGAGKRAELFFKPAGERIARDAGLGGVIDYFQ